MSVDVAHLVLEAPGDTDDEVVDDGADGAEGSDALAGTVVHLNRDDILLGAAEGDGDVGEVLGELACWKHASMRSIYPDASLSQAEKALIPSARLGVHTSGALDGHDSRTNVNLHYRRKKVSPEFNQNC